MSRNAIHRNRLAAAVLTAMVMPLAAFAQSTDSTTTQGQDGKTTELDKVIVTGSLIPQTAIETFKPVTTISAEDIKARGFTSVSDALQQSSFATGGVQGSQTSAGFTQGAETLSLFGLSVSYTKYLIDGRPMADYPALYNGSDAFNNISGIPIDLVERIEILPGGQSSLYGSDAIAGVVNIILKKRLDAPVISARIGNYTEGGGKSFRISGATSFSGADDRFNLLVGAQFEKRDPVWAYDRDLTKQYNQNGTSAPLASRDWLVNGLFGSYHFMDPNNCANVTSAFGGTEGLQTRPNFGDENYCGSLYTPGYRTLLNGKNGAQAYAHATYQLNDNNELYTDILYSRETVRYHIGSSYTWWGTSADFGYYYDPNLDDFVNLQRAFAPEDMGGFEHSMSKDQSSSWSAVIGDRGTIGQSNWDYDAFISSTAYHLNEVSWARLAGPIDAYFQDRVLGPQLGLDPYYGAYPVFEPNYAAFYTLLPAGDIDTFTTHTSSRSRTSDTMLRAQVTNASLFSMPGGDAGVAFAVEGGRQSWRYEPDARLLDGEIWGTTSVSGAGDRDRYAAIGEFRLPVLKPLTLSLSTRYDSFHPDDAQSESKATYSVGFEYRPVESLLFRGKYGTAFKAATLADLKQGESGYYSFVTDYYRCQQLGYDPANVDECPAAYSNRQYFGTTSGSVDLSPMTADVWSAGLVWAPTSKFSTSVDYHHWNIENEVGVQNANGLALREMYCRTGQAGYDINSPVCQDALAKITRNTAGNITDIYTPKVNEALETLGVVTVDMRYRQDIGSFGSLLFRGSYTNNIKHEYTQFPGDAPIDLLRRPDWSSDPKTKANASVTWSKDQWGATLYANRLGHTPNYRSQVYGWEPDPLALAGRLPAYTVYNLSVDYQPTPAFGVSLMVNNLLNDMPPTDRTYPGSSTGPYNTSQFDVLGRAIYLEARYKFGK